MTVLADTSVWVEFLRRGPEGRAAALDRLLVREDVITCGPVAAELFAGAKPGDREKLWRDLNGLPWAELGREQWRDAGDVAAELRRMGEAVPLVDVSIAVMSASAGADLWSFDRDFDRVQRALPSLRRFNP